MSVVASVAKPLWQRIRIPEGVPRRWVTRQRRFVRVVVAYRKFWKKM
jgi:hypothetical protein